MLRLWSVSPWSLESDSLQDVHPGLAPQHGLDHHQEHDNNYIKGDEDAQPRAAARSGLETGRFNAGGPKLLPQLWVKFLQEKKVI